MTCNADNVSESADTSTDNDGPEVTPMTGIGLLNCALDSTVKLIETRKNQKIKLTELLMSDTNGGITADSSENIKNLEEIREDVVSASFGSTEEGNIIRNSDSFAVSDQRLTTPVQILQPVISNTGQQSDENSIEEGDRLVRPQAEPTIGGNEREVTMASGSADSGEAHQLQTVPVGKADTVPKGDTVSVRPRTCPEVNPLTGIGLLKSILDNTVELIDARKKQKLKLTALLDSLKVKRQKLAKWRLVLVGIDFLSVAMMFHDDLQYYGRLMYIIATKIIIATEASSVISNSEKFLPELTECVKQESHIEESFEKLQDLFTAESAHVVKLVNDSSLEKSVGIGDLSIQFSLQGMMIVEKSIVKRFSQLEEKQQGIWQNIQNLKNMPVILLGKYPIPMSTVRIFILANSSRIMGVESLPGNTNSLTTCIPVVNENGSNLMFKKCLYSFSCVTALVSSIYHFIDFLQFWHSENPLNWIIRDTIRKVDSHIKLFNLQIRQFKFLINDYEEHAMPEGRAKQAE